MRTCLKTFLLLLFSSTLFYAQDILEVPLIKYAPQINAEERDTAWQNIPWQSGFTILNHLTEKAAQDTHFKLAHDNHHIYFLIKAFEKQPENLKAVQTERDGKVWSDDCIELFIDPNQEADRFYHFAVNSRGVVSDAEHVQGGHLQVIDWDSMGLQVATKVLEDSFVVELAIPIVDLGFERSDGRISFNIGRESYSTGKHIISSFIPLTGAFAQPAQFQIAQLQNCDLAHFAWGLRSPYETQVIMRDGTLKYEGKLHITNDSNQQGFAALEMSLQNGKKFHENILLAQSLGREYKFSINAETKPETQRLLIELKDKRNKQVLARRLLPVTIKYNPLTLKLSSPAYRDSIFSDMKMSEIVGNLEVHDAKAASLAAQYSLIDSNGKIISELKKESTGEFNLPIPELAEGNYTLLIQVGEYKTEKLIRKLAKLPGEVRFDENKVMYVDGKKTIPYGWFSFPFGEKDLQDLSEIGYTLHVWYASPGNNDDQIRECLNRFAKAGIKCALYPYPNYTMNTGEAVRRPLNQEEAAAIRQRVRNLKNHPALLGWYLHDEPELRAGLPARFMEIHDICQDEDPYHPTIILNTTVAGIHKFAEVADISMPDIYPAFIDGGDAGVDLSVIFNSNMTGNEASERINWFTPQGFDWSDFGRPGQRAPNFVELRNMQYQAVLSGATGFCWFSWAYLESMPEVYLGVNHLVKEARVLSELWFNPQKKVLLPSDSPQVIAANYPDINGVDYIIAVNNTTVSKKIELPASKNLYYALGEKLSFKINNKKLSDNLEKYQVRVYCSDKEIADSFDLNGYKPLLKKALKDLHREGNLAYAYKTGVKIELQQENPGGYPAWHLSDGVYRRSFILSEKDREDAIVSITFPKKVTASKIKLFGKGLKSAELEIKRNGNWVKVANLEKVDDEYLEAEWKKEKFDKLRLIRINAGRISEIEVY